MTNAVVIATSCVTLPGTDRRTGVALPQCGAGREALPRLRSRAKADRLGVPASVRSDVRNAGGIWADASRAPADLPTSPGRSLSPSPGAKRMTHDQGSATVLSERKRCRE